MRFLSKVAEKSEKQRRHLGVTWQPGDVCVTSKSSTKYRCPPPLLEMSATSVYIKSYRKSGWRSPYTKRSHISLSTISVLSDTMLLKKEEFEVPGLEKPHLPQNIAPNPRGNEEETYITILIVLGSIMIKTLFPSLGLKFGTVFPKAIENYQSTYSK